MKVAKLKFLNPQIIPKKVISTNFCQPILLDYSITTMNFFAMDPQKYIVNLLYAFIN